MQEGDKKTINIPFDQAYGTRREELIAEVPRDRVPEGVEVGQMLQTNTQQGPMNVVVKEVNESNVILDANHPLAGKDLIFELEVISIQ